MSINQIAVKKLFGKPGSKFKVGYSKDGRHLLKNAGLVTNGTYWTITLSGTLKRRSRSLGFAQHVYSSDDSYYQNNTRELHESTRDSVTLMSLNTTNVRQILKKGLSLLCNLSEEFIKIVELEERVQNEIYDYDCAMFFELKKKEKADSAQETFETQPEELITSVFQATQVLFPEETVFETDADTGSVLLTAPIANVKRTVQQGTKPPRDTIGPVLHSFTAEMFTYTYYVGVSDFKVDNSTTNDITISFDVKTNMSNDVYWYLAAFPSKVESTTIESILINNNQANGIVTGASSYDNAINVTINNQTLNTLYNGDSMIPNTTYYFYIMLVSGGETIINDIHGKTSAHPSYIPLSTNRINSPSISTYTNNNTMVVFDANAGTSWSNMVFNEKIQMIHDAVYEFEMGSTGTKSYGIIMFGNNIDTTQYRGDMGIEFTVLIKRDAFYVWAGGNSHWKTYDGTIISENSEFNVSSSFPIYWRLTVVINNNGIKDAIVECFTDSTRNDLFMWNYLSSIGRNTFDESSGNPFLQSDTIEFGLINTRTNSGSPVYLKDFIRIR